MRIVGSGSTFVRDVRRRVDQLLVLLLSSFFRCVDVNMLMMSERRGREDGMSGSEPVEGFSFEELGRVGDVLS